MRDFTSNLNLFERIKMIERHAISNAKTVPIINKNDEVSIVYNGPALNDNASAIARIIILKTQLPKLSP